MLKTLPVMGLPVACTDYAGGLAECFRLIHAEKPVAVSACNTHIIAESRGDASFQAVMERFDLILPDGMPVVWLMNRRGAELKDRVYGPYFMRYALQNAPRPWRHFFFGSSERCLAELTAATLQLQPDLEIAGTFSPPFRAWTEEDHAKHARLIRESGADFIWVALGGGRQERWIIEQQGRFRRGAFFAVGDAFELLAGRRPYAPDWMQQHGLTWAYRLYQEPRRLWPRYFKYNSRFVYYLLEENLPFQGRKKPVTGVWRTRIAFVGSRGVPARYAGFETVIDELGSRLAARGYEVTVYNRRSHYPDRPARHRGMRLIYVPTLRVRSAETLVHTLLSGFDALFRKYEIVYLCGVGNALLSGLFRWGGRKLVINVDGIDYKRPKWSGFARWWLRESETWAVHHCDRVIADNQTVVRHHQENYGYTPDYITYGANTQVPPAQAGQLSRWGLEPRRYILFVSRLSPENDADVLIKAYAATGLSLPLVVVGSAGYETAYFESLQKLASPRTIFTGTIFGDGYRELSQNCLFFVLPAAIEATRLVLLDQMGFGNAILFREAEATREVIGDAGESFGENPSPEGALCEKLQKLAADPPLCATLGQRAWQRARAVYDWDRVTDQYEQLFAEIMVGKSK